MARCEDHPACGHEPGCCPDFDENGKQLNMICICGAKLPIDNRYSICDSCMRSPEDPSDSYFDGQDDFYPDEDDFDDSMDGDHESGLRDAGFGTDESYGGIGGEDW